MLLQGDLLGYAGQCLATYHVCVQLEAIYPCGRMQGFSQYFRLLILPRQSPEHFGSLGIFFGCPHILSCRNHLTRAWHLLLVRTALWTGTTPVSGTRAITSLLRYIQNRQSNRYYINCLLVANALFTGYAS